MPSTSPAMAPPAAGFAPAVELSSVTHRFGRRQVLRDITLQLAPGEFACLTGPSGAGKTTLLRLVHGQLWPSAGRVTVGGRDVRRRWGLTALRRHVAFVEQENRLLPRLTALENVAYTLRVTNLAMSRTEVMVRALNALAVVGLAGHQGQTPDQLSAGQRQRLAIARAAAARPAVLLADEPTANLDAGNARRVVALLGALAGRGTTVLLASHDTRHAAAEFDRVLCLDGGILSVANGGEELEWTSA